MASHRVELPDNLPACHAVIIRQAETIERLELRIDQLSRDVTTLKRELYGSRRERFLSPAQEDSPPTTPPAGKQPEQPIPASDPAPPSPRRTSQGRRQRVLDATIPRENILHRLQEQDVSPELWNHPQARRFFRFVREEVELQRASVRVYEHYQEVLVVDDDQRTASRMLTAPAPEPLIERCYVGPAFLAYLATSRFADHIPYYREEEILARTGFSIHRATQWRWMRALAKLVLPLVELLRQRTMRSRVLGIDETPCAMLCPQRGRTRSAYLYAKYGAADQPYVCFEFASHKSEENVRRIVGDYQGYLQSDAYICYELVAASRPNAIIPVACWAHGRRKFEPLVQDGPHSQATWILEQIQKLYDVEDRARLFTNNERHQLRQAESRPLVLAIETWLAERDQHEFPKSPLREGVNYFRNRWDAFRRFLDDGAIPIDNNRTEAVIKGPVMGKKNWLFFGNEQAGETAAIFYTLTMSCRRHCIDVQAYLLDVFLRIGASTPAELESLLPDRWITAHPEARVTQRVQESHAAASRKRHRRAARRLALASG
jgi:transposase